MLWIIVHIEVHHIHVPPGRFNGCLKTICVCVYNLPTSCNVDPKSHSIFCLSEHAGGQPSLDLLWFGHGPEVAALRLSSFFSIFDCAEFSELHGAVEDCLLAALCLVTYIVLQVVSTLSSFFDSFRWVVMSHQNERRGKKTWLVVTLPRRLCFCRCVLVFL